MAFQLEDRNPSHAKLWFNMRVLSNWVIAFGIFIPLLFFLMLLLPMWIADIVAVAAVYYFYVSLLHKRTLWINCNHCGKPIATNTPWICGFCQGKNQQTEDYPFIHCCQHRDCGSESKTYRCHHKECGELIFLTEDHDEDHVACRVGVTVETKTQDDEVVTQERSAKKKRHEVHMAELQAQLETFKRQSEFNRNKTPDEKMGEEFERYMSGVMGLPAFIQKMRDKYNEVFKDDERNRELANLAIDNFERMQRKKPSS